MPASKAKVIEKLSEVNGLGKAYATKAYEELGVRNFNDLVKAAEDNELQTIKGIGAAKEKSILESASELASSEEPAPTPEDKGKKEAPKKETKAKEPKKKKEPKKEKAPRASASPSSSKSSSNGQRRQRTTYRPPTQSKKRPSIPGLLFKLGKKIIGRILG